MKPKSKSQDLFKALAAGLALVLIVQVLLLNQAKAQATVQQKNSTKLSLDVFLDQVQKNNDSFKAAEMNRRAAADYSAESELLLAPVLFADVSSSSDAKPSPFSSFGFGYQRVENNNYSAGISKLFSNGLKTRFAYTTMDTTYVGIQSKYHEARPQLEATLPLWRNLWGRETVGGIDAGRLAALAKAEGQNVVAKATLLEAEASYWRLALARESLEVSKESVARAKAMFSWTERRSRLALSDRSEHLQSTAQLKARELDLRIAEDDERSARLSFNSARGVSADSVTESLDVLYAALISKWATPKRTQTKPEIAAAKLQAEASEAGARAAAERAKPTLELYGLYALNSPQRRDQSDAISDSWKTDRPSSQVGIRFNVPLDISDLEKVRDGYRAEARATQSTISRKLFEQERDWNDLVAKFQLAKEKTRLYEELEKSQRDKLDHERSRQKSGRSTVAQVILFESDYDQSRLSRIRALAEVLNLNAQMKLYGVDYELKYELKQETENKTSDI